MAKNKGVPGLIMTLAVWLAAIGALNWGLIGLFNFNLVETALGFAGDMVIRVVYVLAGVGGFTALAKLLGWMK